MEILITKVDREDGGVTVELLIDGKRDQHVTLGTIRAENYEWTCGFMGACVGSILEKAKPVIAKQKRPSPRNGEGKE